MKKKTAVVSSSLPLFPKAIMDDGTAALTRLRDQCVTCTACRLSETRTRAVFGEGLATTPSVMFVGEAPGANEDKEGRPFIGRAGELLDKMIEAMHLTREAVYIANSVNCRPPNNRVPDEDELKACNRFLIGQIQAVRPKVIVTLGTTASKTLTKLNRPMMELRGQWHKWEEIPLRVTYHPAYLLRKPDMKTAAWTDLQRVVERLQILQAEIS